MKSAVCFLDPAIRQRERRSSFTKSPPWGDEVRQAVGLFRQRHRRFTRRGSRRHPILTNATPRKRPFRQILRQSRSSFSLKTSENRSGKSSTLRAAVRRAPPSEISQRTQRTSGQ